MSKDIRPLVSGILAVISLVGTIVAILLNIEAAQIATLGGFTTTFGAYALGLQSEVESDE